LVSRSPVEFCLDSDPTKGSRNLAVTIRNITSLFRCKLVYGFAHVSTVVVVFNLVPYIVLVDTGIECPPPLAWHLALSAQPMQLCDVKHCGWVPLHVSCMFSNKLLTKVSTTISQSYPHNRLHLHLPPTRFTTSHRLVFGGGRH